MKDDRPMFKGPDGAYYADERTASMCWQVKRWEKYGNRQWMVFMRGCRQQLIYGHRIVVTELGALVIYSKLKETPEEIQCAFSAGEWLRFSMMSFTDGDPSGLLDDSDWWKNKKPSQKTKRPSGARHPERDRLDQVGRYRILKRDGFTCQACGRTPQEHGVVLEVDHIRPVSAGGTSDESNLRTLCYECNRTKGAGAA